MRVKREEVEGLGMLKDHNRLLVEAYYNNRLTGHGGGQYARVKGLALEALGRRECCTNKPTFVGCRGLLDVDLIGR